MAAPSTKRIWERGPSSSRSAPRCSIRTRPGRRSMPRNPESRRVLLPAIAAYLAAFAVFAFAAPATPSLAQAPGYVRVKFVKAGLMVGAGAGGAFVGGVGGVHLANQKGVRIDLQGPRAGMEFAANLSEVRISLK